MCGRFYVEPEISDDELQSIINEINRKTSVGVTTGEVFPSNVIVTIANNRKGEPKPFAMKWGYERAKGSLIINARSETAMERPMFRESMQLRRCLIPATNYFEWQRSDEGKIKYAIRPEGTNLLYMAGLYRINSVAEMASCVILTRAASKSVAAIHNRMPVILPQKALAEWLSPNGQANTILDTALEQMDAEMVI